MSDIKDKHISGLITEIGSNRALLPVDDKSIGWNMGIEKAIHFIKKYQSGDGLFQIETKKSKEPTDELEKR